MSNLNPDAISAMLHRNVSKEMAKRWNDAIDKAILNAARKAGLRLWDTQVMSQLRGYWRKRFADAGIYTTTRINTGSAAVDCTIHCNSEPYAHVILTKETRDGIDIYNIKESFEK